MTEWYGFEMLCLKEVEALSEMIRVGVMNEVLEIEKTLE